MAIATSTIIALGGLFLGGVAAYQGYESRKDAQANYAAQAAEGRKAQGEQKALNFQSQANERRNQVREERVRRAKILAASENSGTAGSSGEMGAVDSLSTQLNSNLAINMGRAEAGNRISGYMQNAADFGTAAQNAVMGAQNWDSIFGVSMNIFQGAGGASALKGT